MNTSTQQEQEQINDGNLVIRVIQQIKKGRKITEKQKSFADLTASGLSVRDWVINQYYRYNSVNHYYDGMESNPSQYGKHGEETLELIQQRVDAINQILEQSTGVLIVEIGHEIDCRITIDATEYLPIAL